jgi:hypothetical protein
MEITFPDLEMRVMRAIEMLRERDSQLLLENASEWTIAHRLAVYLEQQIPGWDVDCEYNRQGDGSRSRREEKRDESGGAIRVDINVHHRTKLTRKDNLLVVELKKREDASDMERVRQATTAPTDARPYQYQFGLMLVLSDPLKIDWYESGQAVP